jgi:serine/threonine-protein kinase
MTESGPVAVREGELIAGKYRVEGVIGVGGMGVVVAARHEQLDQRVAIKLVRDQVLRNPEAVQRFLREARAAAKLKSEHAARVLDVGTLDSGVPYMVMEFLEGCDLAQMLEKRGPLPVDLAAEWVAQACEALAEAHAAGIVHRDLKPQNLFLARSVGGGTAVKVLDFGVSKSAEALTGGPGALTRTRSMLGSPLYMAPEQMRSSRDVDARADVWALGIVLFELLTRRLPFEAETLPELCLKVVSEAPLQLSVVRPDVPATMCQIVARCLEKDRDRRFANAAELAAALGPLMPEGSRSVVERAQWVAASMVGSPALQQGRSGSGPTAQDSPVPARAGTPSAWGSKGGEKAVGSRNVALWVGALILAGVGALGVALVSRGNGGRTGSPPEAPPAPVASSSSAAAQAVTSAPDPVAIATLSPLPTQVASVNVSASAAAVPASASATVHIPAAPTAPVAPFTGRPLTVRPPPAKSAVRDDDIPTLR